MENYKIKQRNIENQNLSDYSKPYFFLNKFKNISFLLDSLAIILIIISLSLGFFYIAPDIQQGENYKIIYLHVPSAWMSLLIYVGLSIFSAMYLISGHPIAYIFSQSLAKVGIIYTFISLVTGSLWGLPVWGTYWVWDARLTSMLVLFFIYLAYLIFSNSFTNDREASKVASILALVGLINLPIIKFSVEWWNTLHQSSTISQMNSSMDLSMLIPLLMMLTALLLYSTSRVLLFTRQYILTKKIESLELQKIKEI